MEFNKGGIYSGNNMFYGHAVETRRFGDELYSYTVYFFINGKFEGVQRGWKNGKLEYEENYKHGVYEGVQRKWYEYRDGDGDLASERGYVNGELVYDRCYMNGELIGEKNFVNGELARVRGYENGKLKYDESW